MVNVSVYGQDGVIIVAKYLMAQKSKPLLGKLITLFRVYSQGTCLKKLGHRIKSKYKGTPLLGATSDAKAPNLDAWQ